MAAIQRELTVDGLHRAVDGGAGQVEVQVQGKDGFAAELDLSPRERKVVLAGGVLNQLREQEQQDEAPVVGGKQRQ